MIDWECELAVVVGRRGKNIPEAKAMEHVFGFTVMNDTSARDLQQKKHGGQWFKGKSLDGHAPLGPWIVTAGGFAHDDLRLRTRVNGIVRQDASTRRCTSRCRGSSRSCRWDDARAGDSSRPGRLPASAPDASRPNT